MQSKIFKKNKTSHCDIYNRTVKKRIPKEI